MPELTQIASSLSFGGKQLRFEHSSSTLACTMRFSVYLPPGIELQSSEKAPALVWLSGLTCNDRNFIEKAGAQQFAAQHGMVLIAPDTSPRGEGVPDDPEGHWDMGLGAGFYLNAKQEPWQAHYQMYDYIVQELTASIIDELPIDAMRLSISGHSMGGHGALTIALKNPHRFRSVSAFAPICAPSECPWGRKAFSAYLGDDTTVWQQYDSCHLIKNINEHVPLLVDQGGDDEFLDEQLKFENLKKACEEAAYLATLRSQPGYDHSYFFIASLIAEHIDFHAKYLNS